MVYIYINLLVKLMSWQPIIFCNGKKFEVQCAVQQNGISQSYEFLTGLPNPLKAKITAIIKRYAEVGIIREDTKFKKLEGNLWEFKSFQTRVIMYHCARGVIALTNGFIKKTKRTPQSEIDRANRIKAEYDQIRKKACHE
jgi:phage-related protein